MRNISLVKTIVFSLAVFFSIRYFVFIINPIVMGNSFFYGINLVADLIAIFVLTTTWLSCLYFEIYKDRYYSEIDALKEKGKSILVCKVSVLVPVVNEPIEIIKQTLEGALAMKGKKDVILLDDGHRDELKELCLQLDINYARRSGREYFKSGNLNHGLKQTNSQFIAVFDADFIPQENFLIETLPLFSDDKIAAVQTPQIYHNQENIFSQGSQYLQTIFYNYIQPAKNLVHSSFCVGTNVIYRNDALKHIGGITLVDHSEDVFTTLKLLEHGYRVFYLNKQLASGLAPDNAISFFNQQYRWAKGGLTMLFRHNTLFNKKLTIDQRLQFFISNSFYLSSVAISIYLLTPIIALIFNIRPINPNYFNAWFTNYVPFFVSHAVLFFSMIKKNRLATLSLGLFCLLPFLKGLFAAALNTKFKWKTTNFFSAETVTKLIYPLVVYVLVSVLLIYSVFIQKIVLTDVISMYYFWLIVNLFIIIYVLFSSYHSVIFKLKI